MIGKIYSTLFPFYDIRANKTSFKKRPVLIIAEADSEDYVILPISTIPHKDKVDPVYDIKIQPTDYPRLNLYKVSYVRTHKQTVIHRGQIAQMIGDLKTEYSELYFEILKKREEFSASITDQALMK